jgi:hypothetical protein
VREDSAHELERIFLGYFCTREYSIEGGGWSVFMSVVTTSI